MTTSRRDALKALLAAPPRGPPSPPLPPFWTVSVEGLTPAP